MLSEKSITYNCIQATRDSYGLFVLFGKTFLIRKKRRKKV